MKTTSSSVDASAHCRSSKTTGAARASNNCAIAASRRGLAWGGSPAAAARRRAGSARDGRARAAGRPGSGKESRCSISSTIAPNGACSSSSRQATNQALRQRLFEQARLAHARLAGDDDDGPPVGEQRRFGVATDQPRRVRHAARHAAVAGRDHNRGGARDAPARCKCARARSSAGRRPPEVFVQRRRSRSYASSASSLRPAAPRRAEAPGRRLRWAHHGVGVAAEYRLPGPIAVSCGVVPFSARHPARRSRSALRSPRAHSSSTGNPLYDNGRSARARAAPLGRRGPVTAADRGAEGGDVGRQAQAHAARLGLQALRQRPVGEQPRTRCRLDRRLCSASASRRSGQEEVDQAFAADPVAAVREVGNEVAGEIVLQLHRHSANAPYRTGAADRSRSPWGVTSQLPNVRPSTGCVNHAARGRIVRCKSRTLVATSRVKARVAPSGSGAR